MRQHRLAYFSLIFICLVWGTTYFALRVAVMHYPPFLFAALRQLASGIIIILAARAIEKKSNLTLKELWIHAVIGFLMITIGNGFVTFAERTIPSGVAALICGMMPLFAVLFNVSISKGAEKLNSWISAGLLLGFLGIGVIFRDHINDLGRPEYLIGIFCTIAATSGWALGSIMNKNRRQSGNPIFNSGLQLLLGGIFLGIISPVVDSYEHVEWLNSSALWSLGYLIVFGSVLAYSAYIYCISKLPVGIVLMYAYINPLVAVLLGYLFLNEEINIYTWIAFAAIMGGVFLVNTGYRKIRREALSAAE